MHGPSPDVLLSPSATLYEKNRPCGRGFWLDQSPLPTRSPPLVLIPSTYSVVCPVTFSVFCSRSVPGSRSHSLGLLLSLCPWLLLSLALSRSLGLLLSLSRALAR